MAWRCGTDQRQHGASVVPRSSAGLPGRDIRASGRCAPRSPASCHGGLPAGRRRGAPRRRPGCAAHCRASPRRRCGICWGRVGAVTACYLEALGVRQDAGSTPSRSPPTSSSSASSSTWSRDQKAQLLCLRLGRLKEAGALDPDHIARQAQQRAHRPATSRARPDDPRRNGVTTRSAAPRRTRFGSPTRAPRIHTLVLGEALTGQRALSSEPRRRGDPRSAPRGWGGRPVAGFAALGGRVVALAARCGGPRRAR